MTTVRWTCGRWIPGGGVADPGAGIVPHALSLVFHDAFLLLPFSYHKINSFIATIVILPIKNTKNDNTITVIIITNIFFFYSYS